MAHKVTLIPDKLRRKILDSRDLSQEEIASRFGCSIHVVRRVLVPNYLKKRAMLCRAWQRAHPKKMSEHSMKWAAAHPESVKLIRARYRERNRKRFREEARIRRANDKAEAYEEQLKWVEENPRKIDLVIKTRPKPLRDWQKKRD